MEARLIALEERLRQTEDVLVAERLARQTAEAAQQTVGPQPQPAGAGVGGGSERSPGLPSLVDTKAIGKPSTFNGDVDVNGQAEGMPWSQWSFVFWSYLGAFDPTATRLLRQVESNVEDPVVVDNTSMTEGERRLSIQLFYVLALTCRGKALQVVRRVPEGFGFEAWKQLCREFEPCLPSRFQGMLQALLAQTRVDDPVHTIYQWESRVKVYEEQSGDKVSENIKLAVLRKYLCDGELARHLNLQSSRLTTNDLARKEAINYLRAKQLWTAPGGSDPMDLSPLGKGKGGKKGKGKGRSDKSVKPGHNKNECRNFSAALRKKSVQPDKAGRYAGVEVDPETGRRKPSGGKGTGAVSPAPGLDTSLLYENDSDQDVYLFPLPVVDECNDSPEDLMALSRQVLFETGAARSVCPTTFGPDVPIEPSEEIPLHQADGTRVAHFGSKFLKVTDRGQ